jgi:hypothetical protein
MTIDSVMSGIEALAPTFDSDISVTVWGYDAIKDTLNEGTCPVRMILAPADDTTTGLDFIALGTGTNKTTWTIVDRVYLMPVTLDMGIQAYNHKYFQYMESYTTAVKNNRCLSTKTAYITNVTASNLYPRAYPEGSEGAFWCIDVILTVEEFI